MLSRVRTVAFQGIDVVPVDVQVQLSTGNSGFAVVGLPDKTIGESRERVRAALAALGLALPPRRIVVNLSPADLLKEGSHYDLPIALALMAAIGAVPRDAIEGFLVLGELALDGSLTRVAGALPAAVAASGLGLGLICPAVNGGEAAWGGVAGKLLAPASLLGLVNHLRGSQVLAAPEPRLADTAGAYADLRDIKGQESAKRVLEIAAAGGHNLFKLFPIDLPLDLFGGAERLSCVAQTLRELADRAPTWPARIELLDVAAEYDGLAEVAVATFWGRVVQAATA